MKRLPFSIVFSMIPGAAWAGVPREPRLLFAYGAALVAGVVFFILGFLSLRRKRLIENLPTSKVRSMALGLVELKGRAVDWNCLRAPLSGEKCVYYQYQVEEYRRSGKNSHWVTVRQGSSMGCPFYLQDETGIVLVHPQEVKAQVGTDLTLTTGLFSEVPPGIQSFLAARGFSCENFLGFDKKLRFTERRLEPGTDLYVLGTCQSNDRAVSQAYLRALKAALQRGAQAPPSGSVVRALGDGFNVGNEDLALVFPTDTEPQPPPQEDRVFVGRSKGMPYLLSDQSERDLTRGLGFQAFFGIFGGAGLLSGLVYLLAR